MLQSINFICVENYEWRGWLNIKARADNAETDSLY